MQKEQLQKNNLKSFFSNLSPERKEAAKKYIKNIGKATVEALNIKSGPPKLGK